MTLDVDLKITIPPLVSEVCTVKNQNVLQSIGINVNITGKAQFFRNQQKTLQKNLFIRSKKLTVIASLYYL